MSGAYVRRFHGWGAKLATLKVAGSTPGLAFSGNNFGQVVHTHVPLSPSSIIWYRSGAVMSCGWEGNRRSGVALAMRHRLQWFIHLRAHGLRKDDEHPAYTPRGVWYSLSYI